ncbi:SH3 domain-containing protein [Pseudobacillus sp. 179-B 2D1 NHS]|uniref:SH3 domain-containing protein n=1 Tax=Pseudobacillus sp. 179-B 2D1 NHS TaxID=3374292 RepID=UPI00387A4262
MKKSISIFLSFVLLFSMFIFNNEAEAAAVNQHNTVNSAKLDVREKPSPRAKIVGSLKKGKVVFVYNTEPGGWSKIKYNNKAGYIATSGLKIGSIKVNYTMDKYGVIQANYDDGETIRLKVGQRIQVKRVDKLNRDKYYDRVLISYGPIDFTNNNDIIGLKPGVSELTIIPFSYNWEDAHVIYIEVYK